MRVVGLIPFDEASPRLRVSGRSYLGVREIPVDRIASWRSTDADLFLWVYQLRRDLRAHDPAIDFDAAARHARELDLGRRRKRHHLREGRRPLPQRDGPR